MGRQANGKPNHRGGRGALTEASYFGGIEQSGPFFKAANQTAVPVRDRSHVKSPNLFKPEYLSPDEVRKAASKLVRVYFGLTLDEVASEVARLLGFRRTGPQLRQMITDEVGGMIEQQALVSRNGKLYSVTSESDPGNKSMSVG